MTAICHRYKRDDGLCGYVGDCDVCHPAETKARRVEFLKRHRLELLASAIDLKRQIYEVNERLAAEEDDGHG